MSLNTFSEHEQNVEPISPAMQARNRAEFWRGEAEACAAIGRYDLQTLCQNISIRLGREQG